MDRAFTACMAAGDGTRLGALNASRREEVAHVSLRRLLTRVPPIAGQNGILLDSNSDEVLPTFGVELEFVAGDASACTYDWSSYIQLGRFVKSIVGSDPDAVWKTTGRAKFMDAFDSHHSYGIKVPDPQGRIWLVRSDYLFGNPQWGRAQRGRGNSSAWPGFELTTPPLSSAVLMLKVLRGLLLQRSLAVVFPCSLPHTQPIHTMCGVRMAQPDRQKADWRTQCGNTRVDEFPPLIPSFHVHVNGSGLCTEKDCRGLVNLILLNSKYEYVLRRLFPIYGPADNSVPLRLAAPQLLAELGALPPEQRTASNARDIFLRYEKQLRFGLCYLLLRGANGAQSPSPRSAAHCAAKQDSAVLWRWWSMKPSSLLGLDTFSKATGAVEFRSAAMGIGAYPLTLRVQLVRRMVLHAQNMLDDLQWTEPAGPEEFSLANQTLGHTWWKMNARGELPWAAAVQRVTLPEMLHFVHTLRFPPALLLLLKDYIRTLDADALTHDFKVHNGLKEDEFDEHDMVLG